MDHSKPLLEADGKFALNPPPELGRPFPSLGDTHLGGTMRWVSGLGTPTLVWGAPTWPAPHGGCPIYTIYAEAIGGGWGHPPLPIASVLQCLGGHPPLPTASASAPANWSLAAARSTSGPAPWSSCAWAALARVPGAIAQSIQSSSQRAFSSAIADLRLELVVIVCVSRMV